ncbi:MAG: cupin domain-containing protein [Elusimicrobia bacterium]|nr:cupin domain-containing protein [Elusimicrobiota bacterium]
MSRTLAAVPLCLALAAALAAAPLPARAQAAAPAAPTVARAGTLDWHASGDLPPGAEYHLIYEDPRTHGVETLVRMPSGYVLPQHEHSADETILVLKGKVILGFGARRETLSPGDYAVIPAGTPFAMTIKGGFFGLGGARFLASFNGPFDVKLVGAKP